MTQSLIQHGSIKFCSVRQGLFGVSYDEGVLRILNPGRHTLTKPTHFLAGFLPSGQQTLAGSNELCAPPHKMKYYMQVRLFTNDGKVGISAFPSDTWTTSKECTDRQYLDDFSCPFCKAMREDLQGKSLRETLPSSNMMEVCS